jgi:dihydroxyacetone kinase-like protein
LSITSTAVRDWIRAYAAEMAEHRADLTKLDAAIGDGDHGTNMDRGMRKALERLDGLEGEDIGAALKAVGLALVLSVGGAAGPLYGTLFLQMARRPRAGTRSTWPAGPLRWTLASRASSPRSPSRTRSSAAPA